MKVLYDFFILNWIIMCMFYLKKNYKINVYLFLIVLIECEGIIRGFFYYFEFYVNYVLVF